MNTETPSKINQLLSLTSDKDKIEFLVDDILQVYSEILEKIKNEDIEITETAHYIIIARSMEYIKFIGNEILPTKVLTIEQFNEVITLYLNKLTNTYNIDTSMLYCRMGNAAATIFPTVQNTTIH